MRSAHPTWETENRNVVFPGSRLFRICSECTVPALPETLPSHPDFVTVLKYSVFSSLYSCTFAYE